MSTNIPQWALDRAWKLIQQTEPALLFSEKPAKAWMFAFARYIAEHEEPPIDPLLIEAREIAATAMKATFADVGDETLSRIRTGEEDDYACVAAAIAALKRGIELGKSNA